MNITECLSRFTFRCRYAAVENIYGRCQNPYFRPAADLNSVQTRLCTASASLLTF